MKRFRFVSSTLPSLGGLGIPISYAIGAVALGMAVPRLEAHFLPGLDVPISVGSATAMLSAIASGLLPLTGLVFSLAFVLVQFSATAYSPRLVAWLTGSATLSHALGIFTATFIYSLAALAWIDRGGSGKVPLLTVMVAMVLLIASMAFFGLLVRRIGTMQISRVLAYAGDQGRAVIKRDYVPLANTRVDALAGASARLATGASANSHAQAAPKDAQLPAPSQTLVHRGGPAVLQAIDVHRLVALAERENAVVSVAWAVGDTVLDGMPLIRVHGARRALPERVLRQRLRLGPERTFEQDPKYALRLLVDISIKALSSAINDPTTAVQALDQLAALLLRLSRCDLDAGRVRDSSGNLRLVFPVPVWDDFVMLAFDEIRYCGASSIQVMRRMGALLHELCAQVPEQRRPALQRYLERVDNGIRRAFEDSDDLHDASQRDRQGLGLSGERHRS